MSKDARTVKMARPGEPDAVRTTIVGGRPPGGGVIPRHIPRGLEVIVKKAAVDPAFKKLLFDKRAEAAKAISHGDEVEFDLSAGTITSGGEVFGFEPYPPELQEIVEAGGLLAHVRAKRTRAM